MKRHFWRVFLILLFLISFTGCRTKKTISFDKDYTIQAELSSVNTAGIVEQINRSSMSDSGYRFANAEYINQISPYATYYIHEAKQYTTLAYNSDRIAMEPVFLERLEDESSLDLTDIFCTVMLLDNLDDMSDKIKKNISIYFDSLYDENLGCYILPNNNNDENYFTNVYPTFLVDTIALQLNIKIKPIDNWLKKTSVKLLQSNYINRDYSSAYVMLFKLLQTHNIKVEKKSSNSIMKMFQDDLENITDLINSNKVYLPVYLMDYLDFCLVTNVDSTKYHNKIIQCICNNNGIREGVIQDYDALGLFAAIRALSLSNYNFEKCPNFNNIFNSYDTFLLDQSSYISPGYSESNFVDTYYVDAIVHNLDINSSNDISIYCNEKKEEILKSDPVNIYYFLDLLQRNNLLEIVELDRKEIVDELFFSLDKLLTSNNSPIDALSSINATLKALNILGEKWSVSKKQSNDIVNSFVENNDIQKDTYNLIELIDFIYIVNPNNDRIEQLCNKLAENIVNLKNTDVSNKVLLQSKAIYILKKHSYVISDSMAQAVKTVLSKAQDSSGLFKGGDSNEDVISFRNTYDALLLYEAIDY